MSLKLVNKLLNLTKVFSLIDNKILTLTDAARLTNYSYCISLDYIIDIKHKGLTDYLSQHEKNQSENLNPKTSKRSKKSISN